MKSFLILFTALLAQISLQAADSTPGYLSPTAIAAPTDGKTLYIACATAKKVVRFDTAARKVVSSVELPEAPSGLALSSSGSELYVTCASSDGKVCVVDLAQNKIIDQIAVGHTPGSPVVSRDGKMLFVCNRFNNDVSFIDLKSRKQVRRVSVQREPTAAALSADGKFLLVANLLPTGKASEDFVAAVVSVINVRSGKVAKSIQLPNGSGSLHDIRVSPDGKYAVVSHILARFNLPASQVDRGWMNANAATIIDMSRMDVLNTVLLDNAESGAANPWGLGWTANGARLIIAHAGTHELSVIDFPRLLAKLTKLPVVADPTASSSYGSVAHVQAEVAHDLSFLLGLRQRIKLCDGDVGPRAVAMVGEMAYVANYFSDSLTVMDASVEAPKTESVAIGPKCEMTAVRQGEIYFHDARICFQGWQSCSSCHPGDARSDALNWDLLNDGIGNPKNNKSLLLVHKTPPAMSLGVRSTGEVAVRSGIKFILFTQQPESVAAALDEYLKSLKPVPSPFLVGGHMSDKAKRGEQIFRRAGCVSCHTAGLLTDLQSYDVGTAAKYDKPADKFDTPTLVEVWRTAPYLHDGSARTIREVVTEHNRQDQHGKTSDLTSKEIDDLCEYVLSL